MPPFTRSLRDEERERSDPRPVSTARGRSHTDLQVAGASSHGVRKRPAQVDAVQYQRGRVRAIGFFRRGRKQEAHEVVELSDAEANEAVETAFMASRQFYDQPISEDLVRLFEAFPVALLGEDRYTRVMKDSWGESAVSALIRSVTRMGYALRVFEEGMPSSKTPVWALQVGLTELMEEDPDMGLLDALLHGCGGMAQSDGVGDEWAGIRGVLGGLGELRRVVAVRTIRATLRYMQEEAGAPEQLPAELTLDDLAVFWRFGFLARSAEVSLPPGQQLQPPAPATS